LEDSVAIFDDKGRTLLLGIAAGAAAVIIGREFLKPLQRLGRPLAKTAVKSGFAAVERGREGVAVMSEHFADLVAEVTAERDASSRGQAK
jgi:hypothetical protein